MKFETKLYKYDSRQESNGYRGEDYSEYILQGDTEVDDLTEILDTVTLTLVDMPFSNEFSPLTKFIYEKWEYIDAETNRAVNYATNVDKVLVMHKDWHLCVAYDIVNQPIPSDTTRFDHQITFNEASVDAQKRIVDNIAVTYKLQDVTLETKPSYDVDANTARDFKNVEFAPVKNWDMTSEGIYDYFGHQFVWSTAGNTDWTMKKYQVLPQGVVSKIINIPIPILQSQAPFGNTGIGAIQGQCSRLITVESISIINSNDTNTDLVMRIDPPSSEGDKWDIGYSINGKNQISAAPIGYILSRIDATKSTPIIYFKKVAEYGVEYSEKDIKLKIEANRKYKVSVTMYNFITGEYGTAGVTPPITGGGNLSDYPYWYAHDDAKVVCYEFDGNNGNAPTENYINNQRPLATLEFECVESDDYITISSRSAEPYNAYDLYNKAMLTTQNYKKQSGIIIDEMHKAYYLEPQDKERLRNTSIVENFYNQKNWWELQLDIGKYIHCIPKVRFGKDDRFVTTWKQLGDTNKRQDNNNKMTIFNSRQVDDYIAGVSSYISNLVQLGGIIDEWVAPKSSSSDYLVYNDVAEIHVSRPIIEIVDVEVKRLRDGAIRNLTGKGSNSESHNGYVYANEIYKTLGIDARTIPNKGMAIWYNLGDKKIQGLNYRLPSAGIYDKSDSEYAIKRIINDAYNGNALDDTPNIKLNDYIFHVVYRTKDTLRTNQVRPDLRKYLLTSRYDKVPQANQFNNQTDTVVDSVKFGNNTYGKLIRTGNAKYTIIEWHDTLQTVKNAGDLYEIRGEWCYVAKAKNTYYANHIISEVEYSKDYNQLSQIIGIPSEPRFYEISEQSSIKREITLDDYIIVGTDIVSIDNSDSYIKKNGWQWIQSLLFSSATNYPQYAITVFKNDSDRPNIAGNESFYVEVCHSLGADSLHNTLTLSWGMEDNFSAGTTTTPTDASTGLDNTVDGAYAIMAQVKYTDIFGRAELLEFALITEFDIPREQIAQLPNNPIALAGNESRYVFGSCDTSNVGSHTHGIGLLKDNREALHFNYNLQMITDSDRFVISSYLWQINKSGLKLALLYEEVNKISISTIPANTIMPTLYNLSVSEVDANNGCIRLNITNILASVDMTNAAAIAVISDNKVNGIENSGAKYFVLARNVSDLDNDSKKADWYISHINKGIFDRQ